MQVIDSLSPKPQKDKKNGNSEEARFLHDWVKALSMETKAKEFELNILKKGRENTQALKQENEQLKKDKML